MSKLSRTGFWILLSGALILALSLAPATASACSWRR